MFIFQLGVPFYDNAAARDMAFQYEEELGIHIISPYKLGNGSFFELRALLMPQNLQQPHWVL